MRATEYLLLQEAALPLCTQRVSRQEFQHRLYCFLEVSTQYLTCLRHNLTQTLGAVKIARGLAGCTTVSLRLHDVPRTSRCRLCILAISVQYTSGSSRHYTHSSPYEKSSRSGIRVRHTAKHVFFRQLRRAIGAGAKYRSLLKS